MSDYNQNAVLYDNHRVNYPQHLRRKYWVDIARRGDVVIRDKPTRPPCTLTHCSCENRRDPPAGGVE